MTFATQSMPFARFRVRQFAVTLTGWAMALPFVIGMVLFLILPCLAILVMAFTDWTLGAQSFGFVGFENFETLFRDRVFQQSLRNTLIFAALVTPISVAIGLWLAVLVEASIRGRAFFRSALFLPVVSTTVAMAIVWEFLLHPTLGPINAMLATIGLPRQGFLADADTVLATLAVIGIWENAGYVMILVLAGLKSIPADLYDAAAIDGVDEGWSRFWAITFPMLGPTMVFVVIISLLRSLRTFDTVAALTQGGPRRSSEVLLWTIYQEGFMFFRVGYAAALTVVFVGLVLAITVVKFRVLDRAVHYE
ncbi:MAG: sugar ABC transporter permease [Pseudomonadota bacterium]